MRSMTAAIVLGACLASAVVVRAADRTAAQILKDIDAIKVAAADADNSDSKEKKSPAELKAREAVLKRAS